MGLLGVQPALELAAGLTLSGRPSRVAPVSRLSRPPAPLGWFLVVGPSAVCPSLVSQSVRLFALRPRSLGPGGGLVLASSSFRTWLALTLLPVPL